MTTWKFAPNREASLVITIRLANDLDRSDIGQLRHEVYAAELLQYAPNEGERIYDPPDSGNVYIVATDGATLVGFVSVTPPSAPRYFLDRYVDRFLLAEREAGLFEVRALTVRRDARGSLNACILLYAALRWINAMDGVSVVAMARIAVMPLYEKIGMSPTGHEFAVGSVKYGLMTGQVESLNVSVPQAFRRIMSRMCQGVNWTLEVPMIPVDEHCMHGGRSFGAIGTSFDRLDCKDDVVSADVLDAWFPPAPGVIAALSDDMSWVCRTSPPALADGLVGVLAAQRNLEPRNIVVGAGSSDLMYRAFSRLLTKRSRVLLVKPSYGEYRHIIENVIGAQVDYLAINENSSWKLNLDRLHRKVVQQPYDLVVIVNPSNPTGDFIDADLLRQVIRSAPSQTLFWVDEAYLDYIAPDGSLERYVTESGKVVVCKSLSKVFALSGLRIAYLVAPSGIAADLRRWSPPWPVSLPGQIAAVAALNDRPYYEERWRQTATLRKAMAIRLREDVGVSLWESCANFIVVSLPRDVSAIRVVRECEKSNVFLRDLTPLSEDFEGRHVRIAIKDSAVNDRVTACLALALAAIDS